MRIVVVAILVVFGVRVSLAYADPCTVHPVSDETAAQPGPAGEGRCCPGDAAATGTPSDDDEGCSCPIDCHQGCAGTALAALVPPVGLALRYIGDSREVTSTPNAQSPPRATPHDILHVPRPS